MSRCAKRVLVAAVVVVVLLAILGMATPQGRAAVKTVGLVAQVVPGAPVKPLPWVTGEPKREAIT